MRWAIFLGLGVMLFIFTALLIPRISSLNDSTNPPIQCGGFAGLSCPVGYKCQYEGERFPDAAGVCRPSLGEVLKNIWNKLTN